MKRLGGVEHFFMLNSERFAPLFSKLLKIELKAGTIEQVKDVRSTLAEALTVPCPCCDQNAQVQLGRTPGSSALHFCSNCKTRFHIHRSSDGNVFTREWGASKELFQDTHRVVAVCPKCSQSVPANFRDDEISTQRYCMNCCSLLTIDASGQVLSSQPSSPVVGAKVTGQGNLIYIYCPRCPAAPPRRPMWQDGPLVRTFCPSCLNVIEGKQTVT